MTKKNKDDMPKRPALVAGRRPKPPSKKVGWPVRFLVTPPVIDKMDEIYDRMGLDNKADLQRLALYRFLDSLGELTPELRQDPTFENLRRKGLV